MILSTEKEKKMNHLASLLCKTCNC